MPQSLSETKARKEKHGLASIMHITQIPSYICLKTKKRPVQCEFCTIAHTNSKMRKLIQNCFGPK